MSIVIMVDGGINITRQMIKIYSIDVSPYNLIINDQIYRDTIDIKNQKDLKDLIYEYKGLPQIVNISIDQIKQKMRKCIEKGDDILYITTSSKLSSSYENVMEASREFNSNMIEVIDSLNVGGGLTLLTIKAREYIDKGYGLKQIAKNLNSIKNSIKSCYMIGCLNDISIVLNDKPSIPILEIDKGRAIVTYTAKDKELALQILKNTVLDNISYVKDAPIVISYSGDKSMTNRLKQYIKKNLSENVLVLENNAAICINAGYDTISLSFLAKK